MAKCHDVPYFIMLQYLCLTPDDFTCQGESVLPLNGLMMFIFSIQRDKDVDMKQISKSGNGLLHAAVNTGDPSIVRLLLDAGADVNQTNMECEGVTPLHLAIMQGKLTFC